MCLAGLSEEGLHRRLVQVPDPRDRQGRVYPLERIGHYYCWWRGTLAVALRGVWLSGADRWQRVCQVGAPTFEAQVHLPNAQH
jgi:hypothetical protein